MCKAKFIDLCVKNGLFTCGSCSQYSAVMDLYAELKTPYDRMFEPVVYMTWICSDTERYTVQDIRLILGTSLF